MKINQLSRYALRTDSVRCIQEDGQDILWPDEGKTGEILFELSWPDETPLIGFDAGARFLDLRDGLAPDKFTAETRPTRLGRKSSASGSSPKASFEWAVSRDGAYANLWEYDPQLRWKDGVEVGQVLRWPEVDRQVRSLPAGTRKIYIRYRFTGMGMDSPRLAVLAAAQSTSRVLEITHEWYSDGKLKNHVERISGPAAGRSYRIDTGPSRQIVNHALTLYCPPVAVRLKESAPPR